MLLDNKISKGGLMGAVAGLLASLLIHKHTDSTGKRAVKSGALGAAGYFLGVMAEKKFKGRNKG